MRWLLILGLVSGCVHDAPPAPPAPPARPAPPAPPARPAPPAAACALITSEDELAACVGKTVTVRGPVIRSKNPSMLGVDISLDGAGELPGDVGQATGVLSQYTIPEPTPGDLPMGSRGPGTYYSLANADGNGLAKVTPVK